jgi:hypothetical protein
MIKKVFCFWILLLAPLTAWDRHDIITQMAIAHFRFVGKDVPVAVETIESFMNRAYGPGTQLDSFLRRFQFNPNTEFHYRERKSNTSFAEILKLYAAEPDETMDLNILHPDQKYMGGSTGETARGFRHLFYRRFELFDFFPTFHVPMREMGQAPVRAQVCFGLAVQAAKAGSPYWAYRFLAWSLHYVQDITNPLHSTQIPTLRMLPLKSIFAGFDTLVSRSSQVISNYHFQYEKLVGEILIHDRGKAWAWAIGGQKTEPFKSANAYVRDNARKSSKKASELGRATVALLGCSFFDPSVDVPAFPKRYPIAPYEKTLETEGTLWKITTSCLSQTGVATRSLISKFIETTQ